MLLLVLWLLLLPWMLAVVACVAAAVYVDKHL